MDVARVLGNLDRMLNKGADLLGIALGGFVSGVAWMVLFYAPLAELTAFSYFTALAAPALTVLACLLVYRRGLGSPRRDGESRVR